MRSTFTLTCAAAMLFLTHMYAVIDSDICHYSDIVDIFDGNAGKWHTAQLSVAREGLSATSMPSQGLAMFAGGDGALVSL